MGKDRVAVVVAAGRQAAAGTQISQRTIAALFAPSDQIIIALAGGDIEFRAIATGAGTPYRGRRRQSVAAVSADGRLLATSQIGGTSACGTASGKLLRTFGHELGATASLAFSPDGTLLASAGYDANVHFWDVSTGQRKASVRDQVLASFAISFTADGRNLIIGGASGAIEIADVQTGAIARRLRTEKHAVSSLSLSADGRSIGATYFDVDGMARPAPLVVWELASGRVVNRVTPPGAPPMTAGFAADGRLLYATAKGQEMTVWVLGTGAPSAGRN